MKTQQIMKRDFLGVEVRQNHKTHMISLTDINKLVPQKFIANFMATDSCKVFMNEICRQENLAESEVLTSKKGKNGGTWGHPLMGVKFAMWLSPSFEYHAIKWVHDHLCEFRDICGDLTREINQVIKEVLKPTEPWTYANEANMMQGICGIQKGKRNDATEDQLKMLEYVQKVNIKLLKKGVMARPIREAKIREAMDLVFGGIVYEN